MFTEDLSIFSFPTVYILLKSKTKQHQSYGCKYVLFVLCFNNNKIIC